jgi:hypothetical protein
MELISSSGEGHSSRREENGCNKTLEMLAMLDTDDNAPGGCFTSGFHQQSVLEDDLAEDVNHEF